MEICGTNALRPTTKDLDESMPRRTYFRLFTTTRAYLWGVKRTRGFSATYDGMDKGYPKVVEKTRLSFDQCATLLVTMSSRSHGTICRAPSQAVFNLVLRFAVM